MELFGLHGATSGGVWILLAIVCLAGVLHLIGREPSDRVHRK